MTLGERLKLCRHASQMTQVQLADKSGVHHNMISLYELDKAEPSLLNACCLADTLGVPLDFLAGRLSETDEREIWVSLMSKKKIKFDRGTIKWMKTHGLYKQDGGC